MKTLARYEELAALARVGFPCLSDRRIFLDIKESVHSERFVELEEQLLRLASAGARYHILL